MNDEALQKRYLLLTQIASYYPYGLKVEHTENDETKESYIEGLNIYDINEEVTIDDHHFSIYDIKPILRPLSSVTEDEWKECKQLTCPNGTGIIKIDGLHIPLNHYGDILSFSFMESIISWCLSNKIDIYNLIRDGLAKPCDSNFYK